MSTVNYCIGVFTLSPTPYDSNMRSTGVWVWMAAVVVGTAAKEVRIGFYNGNGTSATANPGYLAVIQGCAANAWQLGTAVSFTVS